MSSEKRKLHDRLWTVFSKYIRLRDSDVNGYCKCISCGRIRFYKDQMDAGHFIPKNRGNYYWFHEDNVHAQCRHCNSFLHGNLSEYRANLIKKIGQQKFDLIHYNGKVSYSTFEYNQLIRYYRDKIKELIKQKNL